MIFFVWFAWIYMRCKQRFKINLVVLNVCASTDGWAISILPRFHLEIHPEKQTVDSTDSENCSRKTNGGDLCFGKIAVFPNSPIYLADWKVHFWREMMRESTHKSVEFICGGSRGHILRIEATSAGKIAANIRHLLSEKWRFGKIDCTMNVRTHTYHIRTIFYEKQSFLWIWYIYVRVRYFHYKNK